MPQGLDLSTVPQLHTLLSKSMDSSLFDNNALEFTNGLQYDSERDSMNPFLLNASQNESNNSCDERYNIEERRESISAFFESSIMPNGFRRFSFGFPSEGDANEAVDLKTGKSELAVDDCAAKDPSGIEVSDSLEQKADSIFKAVSTTINPSDSACNENLKVKPEIVQVSQSLGAGNLSRPLTPTHVGKASARVGKNRSKSPYTYPGSPFGGLVPGVQGNGAYHGSGMNSPTSNGGARNVPPRPSSTPAMLNFANSSQQYGAPLYGNGNAYHLPSPAVSSPRDALSVAMSMGMSLNSVSPTHSNGPYHFSPTRSNFVGQSSPLSRQPMPTPPMSSGDLANVAIMLSSMPFGNGGDISQVMAANGLDVSGLGADSKVYHCPKPGCTKMYRNLNGLKYHMRQGRCDMDLNECDMVTLENTIAEKPYWCRSVGCRKKFKNLNGLKYHIRTQHPNEDVIALTRNCRVTLSNTTKRVEAPSMDFADMDSPILDFA